MHFILFLQTLLFICTLSASCWLLPRSKSYIIWEKYLTDQKKFHFTYRVTDR